MTLAVRELGADYDQAQALDVWAVVQRVQAGEVAAYAQIWSRYQMPVFRFVLRRVAHRETAEDLTAATFEKALRNIGSFTWQGREFGAWLTVIAKNLIFDHFKSGRYRLESTVDDIVGFDQLDYQAQPDTTVVDGLTHDVVMAAMERIAVEQRQCIEFRFLRQMSVAETAAAMGKNEPSVKSLQWRAIQSLRMILGRKFDERMPAPGAMR